MIIQLAIKLLHAIFNYTFEVSLKVILVQIHNCEQNRGAPFDQGGGEPLQAWLLHGQDEEWEEKRENFIKEKNK